MSLILVGVAVLALPDIAHQVAQDTGEVMVAPATPRWCNPKLAAGNDATEAFVGSGQLELSGAAPKRGASVFAQTT